MTREQLYDYVKEDFGVEPDFPFDKDFKTAILRHKGNKKWFGAVLPVEKNKITGNENRIVDVLDLKCDPMLRQPLLQNKGVYVAYHMNKVHWISVILEEVSLEEVVPLVEMSYDLIKNKTKSKK